MPRGPASALADCTEQLSYYLFRSAIYWFGWLYVFVVALLVHNLYRAIMQSYFPTDIDIMNCVR